MFLEDIFGRPKHITLHPREPWNEPEGTLDPTDVAVQDKFIQEDITDFLDFLRQVHPEAVKDYLERSEEPFKDYCGVNRRE